MSRGEPETVDYDAVAAAYAASLTTQLRGFRGGAKFLESWVHDPDDARSILNMIEAAAASGLTEVRVVIGPTTADRLDRPSLEAAARKIGEVDARPDDYGRLVVVVRFRAAARDDAGGTRAALDRARAARKARDERLDALAAAAETRSRPVEDRPHAVHVEALRRLMAEPAPHEGTRPPGAGAVRVSAVDAGLTLWADVDPGLHVVVAAGFVGADSPERRAALEALSRLMEGAPLLEAADHAVIRLEAELRDHTLPRPVAGMVTPESTGPWLAPLTRLCRALLADYRRRQRYDDVENRFDPEPRPAWKALSHGERLVRLQSTLDALVPHVGLRASDVVCTRLDRTTRVTVEVHVELPAIVKAKLLMDLERALKAALEPALHLVHEEMHDKNKLRRL